MGKTFKKDNMLTGLKSEYLSPIEVLAQSIASIAPSASAVLVIPLVFSFAGNGTWLTYLFAMAAILLVGANLKQFSKRYASAGNLYAYIIKGLGTNVGVISGWALILAYLLTASAVLCGFINYANVLLSYAGITVPAIVIGIAGATVAWYVAVRDIKLSANIMLVFEGISIALITLLAIVILFKRGLTLDFNQFSLKGVSPPRFWIGLVLSFFSYVGFESATSLGSEAKKPLKTIPKVLTLSTVVVGVFLILLSYSEVFGYIGNSTALNEATAPLAELADFHNVGFFGPLISIGALISFWASFLACTNAGGRIFLLMGQHGIFNPSVGNTHNKNKTPHIAITISTIAAAVIPFALILNSAGLVNIYGWVGTIATYGFILAYALITVSTPIYLYREKEFKSKSVVLAVVTVLVLLIPIVGSVYSNALSGEPYSRFIYIFLAWLVAGGLWLIFRKIQFPGVESNISENIEDINRHFKEIRINEEKY